MLSISVAIVEPYAMELGGGNQKAQERILRLIDRSRFSVTFVVPFETEFSRQLAQSGIDVVVVPPPDSVARHGHAWLHEPKWKRALMAADTLRYGFRIGRALAAHPPDVFYCSSTRAVLIVALSAWLKRIPILFYVNGDLENPLLDSIAIAAARRIAFQGPANLSQLRWVLRRVFRSRLCIIPKGILLDEVRALLPTARQRASGGPLPPSGGLKIAYCGLVHRGKGIHDLLEAISQLPAQFADSTVHIVGGCSIDAHRAYAEELRVLASRLGILDRVTFTGWRADAIAVLAEMDVVVHPSLAEGFPTVVLEAMALGKAVVATRVGELRSNTVIEDGTDGFLVEPGSPRQIADKLARLLADPALRERMGQLAQAKVLREHPIERQINRLEELWAELAVTKGQDDAPPAREDPAGSGNGRGTPER